MFVYICRTKLGVTTAQVEDQKAYIKQLTSTEADPGLIENNIMIVCLYISVELN